MENQELEKGKNKSWNVMIWAREHYNKNGEATTDEDSQAKQTDDDESEAKTSRTRNSDR
ncbi:uncharacterized protein RAG0_17232 [Rhynchosporium agropyri]|uniref:Uncharacterized protein n=1 Tax=Rhynchosporium agropyri TaxID=914238 RepID=A0A1E1LTE1_9HELO|nr:uncharacterized protein RAG0_17232 [Rhynchosporium agropyri]